MSNHLAGETSPYLLQHADNPVDWHPWGEEALALSRAENRPILLSIGYSACHWCHVMAHESFEDPEVAAVMNRLFVNIKVDREERPDLDQIYQTAQQLLTGRPGGWPLTLFLSPDGTPFFGGTYFPRRPRFGLPAFGEICERVAEVWRSRAEAVAGQNRSLREILAQTLPHAAAGARPDVWPDARPIAAARDLLLKSFDPQYGGFGRAPKFPHATDLALLLELGVRGDRPALDAVSRTLTFMAAGGLYDQLGGGFCRYSVDERWEIPHFEKMLYDNGQLLGLYADTWAATGEPLFACVVEETAAWLAREMQLPEGGYASSLDADSEGEEGRYYLWDRDAVPPLLTAAEWAVAARHWGLDGPPNFENARWHLRVAAPLAPDEAALIASARRKLFAERERRPRPGRDDKVLASWNALTVAGLIRAARVFGRADWLAEARRALDFLRAALWRDGRLLATWRAGRAHLAAYLDDHALLLAALLESLQAGCRRRDLDWAVELADGLIAHFEDGERGGFHFTAHDHEALILRPKPAHDNSLPAGNAVAALALTRLGSLLDEARWLEAAERTLRLFRPQIEAATGGTASLLLALQAALEPPATVILRGPAAEVADWAQRLARRPAAAAFALPLANGSDAVPSALTKPETAAVNAWVCTGVSCLAPVGKFADLDRILRKS